MRVSWPPTLPEMDQLEVAPQSRRGRTPIVLVGVLVFWIALAVVAVLNAEALGVAWPRWSLAFVAAAVWGLNLLLLVYAVGRPLSLSSVPFLTAGFGLAMTVFGSGNYWAATQLYPAYRAEVERAAYFVAVCTCISLIAVATVARHLRRQKRTQNTVLVWDWLRLRLVTYLVFVVALVGTVIALQKIGYVPLFTGDPANTRIEFPVLGGIWYRLSMLGVVAAILVGVLAAARQATPALYGVGLASLTLVGVYGPRFFVVLPLGVAVLLWTRLRHRLSLGRIAAAAICVLGVVALAGYWRERDASASLLGPIGLVMYFIFVEFRELAWALEHYGAGDQLLAGASFGSAIVPLMPSVLWNVVGIDKAAIYGHSSAAILADEMGTYSGQRIGAYGEFFINFGWTGAIVGAALYGVLVAYLDHRFRGVNSDSVRGVFLALTVAAAVFAQIGQLDVFTTTLTGVGYPLALIALLAARRSA